MSKSFLKPVAVALMLAVAPLSISNVQAAAVKVGSYVGIWSAKTSYAAGDLITLNNKTFLSLVARNLNKNPETNTALWQLLGGVGATGLAGPAGTNGVNGAQGLKGDSGPAGIFPANIDRTPPVITTTAPFVATSSNVTFTTTMSDDVELAYISRSNTGYGQFVFVADGIKDDQANDSAYIALGQTYTKMLMAVDTSGNVTKETITMTTPETAIKLGTYKTLGAYSLPAGFNCLTGWSAVNGFQDGEAVTNVIMSSRGNWSEVGGYEPAMSIKNYGVGVYRNVPLSATSLISDVVVVTMTGSPYSYSMGYITSATLTQTNPPTLDITLNMKCNENNAGFVNGTTATFTVNLLP